MKKAIMTSLIAATVVNAGVSLDPIVPEPRVKATYTEDFSVKAVTPQAKKFVETYVPVLTETVAPLVVAAPVLKPVVIEPTVDDTSWFDGFYIQGGVGAATVQVQNRYVDKCKGKAYCVAESTWQPSLFARVGYDINEQVATYVEYERDKGVERGTKSMYNTLHAGVKYTYLDVNLFASAGKTRIKTININDDVFSAKCGIGYAITHNFGIEASYLNTGKVKNQWGTKVGATVAGIYLTAKFGGLK